MNKNLEIRIWANTAGFEELTAGIEPKLMSVEQRSQFSPDQFRSIASEEYLSFFYTLDAVWMNLHYLQYSNKLRAPRVVISVAVARGYRMENVLEALQKLKSNFAELISDPALFPGHDVNGIENILMQRIPEWENAIALTTDTMNLSINIFPKDRVGYVAYASQTDLQEYVKVPLRQEYKDYRVVFLVPESAQEPFATFAQIQATPVYQPVYTLFFPGYQEKALCRVSSLDEEITQTCSRKYYKTIELKGSIRANMANWMLTPIEDGLSYNVGLLFAPETKEYVIRVSDSSLAGDFSWLKVSFGTIQGDKWILVGEEQAKAADVLVTSLRPEIRIENHYCMDGILHLTVRKEKKEKKAPVVTPIAKQQVEPASLTLYWYPDNLSVQAKCKDQKIKFYDQGSNRVIDKEGGECVLEIEGYKPKSVMITDGTNVEYCVFEPLFKTRLKQHLLCIVIGVLLVIMFAVGGVGVGYILPHRPVVNDTDKAQIQALSDSIEVLNQEIDSLKTKIKSPVALKGKQGTPQGTSDATAATTSKDQQKLDAIVKKLLTQTDYKQQDIIDGRKLAQKLGITTYESLFVASEKALGYCNLKAAENLQSQLNQLKEFVKPGNNLALGVASREQLTCICNDEELQKAYTTKKVIFHSIDEMMEELKKNKQ